MDKQIFKTFTAWLILAIMNPLSINAENVATITLPPNGNEELIMPDYWRTYLAAGSKMIGSPVWKSSNSNVVRVSSFNRYTCRIHALDTAAGQDAEITCSFSYWEGVRIIDYDLIWTVNVSGSSGGGSSGGSTNSDLTFVGTIPTDSWSNSGNYSIDWYNKDSKVFTISNNKQLAGLAYLVNNNYTEFEGQTIRLANDIDLTGKQWRCIGQSKAFKGNFDGQGHTIFGIFIGQQETNQSDFGFWGYVSKATITNTNFEGDVFIDDTPTSRTSIACRIGGVVGYASSSTFENCRVRMPIAFEKRSSYTFSTIRVGGFAGYSTNSKYKYCSHVGDLNVRQKVTDSPVPVLGGLIGYSNSDHVEYCENISDNVYAYYPADSDTDVDDMRFGGILGDGSAKVTSCRSILGAVEMENKTKATTYFYIGGITGNGSGTINNSYSSIISVKFNSVDMWYNSGSTIFGGICASNGSFGQVTAVISACFSNSDVSTSSIRTIVKGNDGSTAYDSEQMKTASFLNELNLYPQTVQGKSVWMQDDAGYPYIPAVYSETLKFTDVESISLDKTVLDMSVGGSRSLFATVLPENATNKDVVWKSSDEKVATVSPYGNVKAIAEGTATITCAAADGSGVQATCEVNVFKHAPGTYFKVKTVEGIEMTFYVEDGKSGECMVNSYCIDQNTTGTVTIPTEADGLKVTAIRGEAFYNRKALTKVNIPNTVTSIGKYAFEGCTAITSISLDGVKSIDSSTFWGCTSLASVTNITQLEYIGSGAFHSTPWYDKLPDGLLYLGKVLYEYKGTMPQNTEIAVKEGTVSISPYAFSSSNLVSLSLPKSLSRFDYSSIRFSDGLTKLVVNPENVTYDSREDCNAIIETATNTLVRGCKVSTIPNSVDSIGNEAFYGAGLTAIVLGSGVRKIGQDAFQSNGSLKSIKVAEDNRWFDSREDCNAIIETANNRLVVGCPTTSIPSTVKVIGSYAFYTSTNLETLRIPDTVESIERCAFQYQSLRTVTIGRGVTDIAPSAFYACSALQSVHSLIQEPFAIDKSVFSSINSEAILYVPIGTQISYMTTNGWDGFTKIAEIADNVLVEGETFINNTEEGVELTYRVSSVVDKTCELIAAPAAIYGTVTIPDQPLGYTVTSIGGNVFASNSSSYPDRHITRVSIPSHVTNMDTMLSIIVRI